MQNSSLNDLILYYKFLINNASFFINIKVIKSEEDLTSTLIFLEKIKALMILKKYKESVSLFLEKYPNNMPAHMEGIRNLLNNLLADPNLNYDVNTSSNSNIFNDNHSDISTFISEINNKLDTLKLEQQTASEEIFDRFKNSVLEIDLKIKSIVNSLDNYINTINNSLNNHNQIVALALNEVSTKIEFNQRKMLTDLLQHEVKEFTSEAQKFVKYYTSYISDIENHTNRLILENQKIATQTLDSYKNITSQDIKTILRKFSISMVIISGICALGIGSVTGYITAKYTEHNFIDLLSKISSTKKN